MPNPDKPDDDSEDYLSPKDIKVWTEREIRNAKRALDLKVKELSSLSSDYSKGKLTPEQADEAHSRYHHRWGEALPGVLTEEGLSDQEIIAKIDAARPFTAPRQAKEAYRRAFGDGKSR